MLYIKSNNSAGISLRISCYMKRMNKDVMYVTVKIYTNIKPIHRSYNFKALTNIVRNTTRPHINVYNHFFRKYPP